MMTSIYCGGTADDVPLFCVDVARTRKNLVLGETLVTTGTCIFPLWKSVMTDEIELLYSLVRF